MQPTVDSFRALARSSPWRWRTLHFTRRGGSFGEVEAWLRRPGQLLVRPAGRPEHYVTGVPYARSAPRTSGHELAGVPEPPGLPGPTFRPDGLVAERPAHWYLEHGDPMWQDYTWTAMLDPDELSDAVEVDDVRAGELYGREVWWARLRPVAGYEPRCGCCPLLWSEVAVVGEYGAEPDRLARFRAEGFPDAHDVALDVGTAVVAALEPVGGTTGRGFTLEIHEVDAALEAVFAGRPSP